MVREEWEGMSRQIEMFSAGHECRVLDDIAAKVAIQGVQRQMDGAKSQAGVPDADPDVFEYTEMAMRAGVKDAKLGACERMTPSDRARLRQAASSYNTPPRF